MNVYENIRVIRTEKKIIGYREFYFYSQKGKETNVN